MKKQTAEELRKELESFIDGAELNDAENSVFQAAILKAEQDRFFQDVRDRGGDVIDRFYGSYLPAGFPV